jgi:hypothetical protein
MKNCVQIFKFELVITILNIKILHFLLSTYGIWEKYWFRDGKIEKKIITDFQVLVIFMAKKHDLSNKNFSVCHETLRSHEFSPRLQPPS